ncbi:P-loop containing nucleoside triphosphate hydrolase protein [Gymnopilus junonius]|uniref:Peroxisomal ATPase PEX1 n=1 Tax=Gymnopilus junonius TaxID=109634 RepID=A0A9P5NLE7_GYMJU|nr:P-loop containing nucleoside triphosphate hydrolase protein [Gymnopilus junonius]
MPKKARVHFVSLRSSLVNLPISIYGPLVERSIRPQQLAVHLTLLPEDSKKSKDERVEAYVGWTGMASASSLAQFNAGQNGERGLETIEIDPQYAQSLGLALNDIVEIGLLHDVPPAKSVATEPVTSDDWEIIEIHAAHVESTLLSQVRVAKVGQEIDVWVLGRTRVRLRVTSLDPAPKNNVLLLTTNTEVSIAPKLHRSKDFVVPKPLINGHQIPNGKPIVKDESKAPSDTPTTTTEVLRVLPLRLVPALKFPEHNGPELLVSVSAWTLAQLFGSESLEKSDYFYQGNFTRLAPPPEPSSPSSPPPPPEPSTTILNPGGKGEPDSSSKPQPDPDLSEIYICSSEQIPGGHIVYYALPEGLKEWDLVRCLPFLYLTYPSYLVLTFSCRSVPSSTFLAGVDQILERGMNYCIRELFIHSARRSIHGASGLLVTGRSGSGKTSIVRAIAKSLQDDPRTLTYLHYVDTSKLSEQPISSVKTQFNFWFDTCAWHRPSILILDDLDKLLSAEVEHADSFRSRHLTEIFLNIFGSSARTAPFNFRGIIILATAESTSSIHPLINTAHVFKEVVHVTPPNKEARRDILSRLVHERLKIAKDITQDPDTPINFTEISTQTEGYSATDLKDLVARAIHQVAMRSNIDAPVRFVSLQTDFTSAQKDFVPLSLRDVKLEKSDTRRTLRETLEWPTKYGPIFKQSPLRLRSGLLLYGFPGCGKTLLASAVAKECGLNFISVKGPEILNKYIGASEKSVRDLFERASAAKPCVLFFDEFDSVAPKRGHDSTGVTDRVVNQMLTQMDGAEGLEGVYVLAATSRPDLIDSALLRPGRLDKSLFCNMPDFQERKDILKAVARKMTLSSTVDLDEIASKTEGFSGADLQALLYNAHLDVIHAAIVDLPSISSDSDRSDDAPVEYTILGDTSAKPRLSKAEEMALKRRLRQILSKSNLTQNKSADVNIPPPKKTEIRQADILKSLKSTRPSVSPEEQRRLGRIYQDFISDRSGNLPVPPEAGGVGSRATLG